MGWKSVKEHYRIAHIVQVRPEGICIGSAYVSDLIVINLDGTLSKKRDANFQNEDLKRYVSEMFSDQKKLKELIDAPDKFSRSLPVYTWDGGDIVEKKCEELGWPNVTHDGSLMYENTFSQDRAKVIKWARDDAECAVKMVGENILRKQKEIEELQLYLQKRQGDLDKLVALV